MGQVISRHGAFLGLLRLIARAFSERLRPLTGRVSMSSQTNSPAAHQIVWPTVITVISAASLIASEVFGSQFAAVWGLGFLFSLDGTGAHILQALFFALGVFIM